MNKKLCFLGITSIFLLSFLNVNAQAPNLNSAANFDLFTSVGAITNTGNTQFTGNIGTNSGAITGFAPITAAMHIQDATTATAATDLLGAYNQLIATVPTITNHAPAFGNGETLLSNIYEILGASSIAGILTLDAQDNPNAIFIFKVGGAFTSAASATIILTNGASANNIFWVIEGAVSFAANTVAKGTFISHSGAISFGVNTNLYGRALTLNGAIDTYATTLNTSLPNAENFTLGTVSNFIVFTTAGAITNAGTSSITGAIGTNFGSISGFPVGTNSIYVEDETTAVASSDLAIVYANLIAQIPTNTTHAPAFGSGETLTSGVYAIGGASSVAGNLILDGEGNPDAVFIFQIGGAFTTGAGTHMSLINGAAASNVYWVSDGAFALAADVVAVGTFIAHAGAISIGANCSLAGRTLSMAGAITLLDNMVLTLPINLVLPENQVICYGTIPADIVITGTTENPIKWQKSSTSNFSAPLDIVSTSVTLTGITIGNLTATTWFRAVFGNTVSLPIKITVGSDFTIWDGVSWSNGEPNIATTAFITANYTSTTHLTACAFLISNNATVLFNSGNNLILKSNLSIAMGGHLTFEDNSNLIQLTNVKNSNSIITKSNSSPLMRLDYTLWSSPVEQQNMLAFSPNTLVGRFYDYDSLFNIYTIIPSVATTNFAVGIGYLIRTPNNFPTVPTTLHGSFEGIPNNGTINVDLVNGGPGLQFNLVGNPYPSALDANAFVNDNSSAITGTLYFWRKTNNALNPSYCTWNTSGFIGNDEVMDPNNIIAATQGFFVEAKGTANNLVFKNTQRIGDNVGHFFKTEVIEKNRIWLDATGANGAYSQLLLGYMTNATSGEDFGMDGKYNNDGAIAISSLLGTTPYAIQSRALPFDTADVVPLQFKATNAGTYTIAIHRVDGLFLGDQAVYLKDNLTNTCHDLKTGAYTFASTEGTFNNRFEIVYQTLLAVTIPSFNESQVIIYKTPKNEISINTGQVIISTIKIFDVIGKLLLEKKDINSTQILINIGLSSEILLIQITSNEGVLITKKILFP